MAFLNILLDIALIILLATGILYAIRLSRQLKEMRQSRLEMQKFVFDFNASVTRAENGIRALKETSRSCGDDLENLIDKGRSLRDELHFLTESADHLATRLSNAAPQAAKPAPAPAAKPATTAQNETQARQEAALRELQDIASGKTRVSDGTSSAAERDLLRALQKKMG